MSRIIVKNLPKSITEKKLREIFEAQGTITDLQLKYNKAGVFRQFAFIGYKTEDEAKAAKEYFNNTFVLTSKIQVEFCASLNDPNKPKAWKEFLKEKAEKAKSFEAEEKEKKTSKEEKEVRKKKKSKKDDIPEELKQDPKFQEFMEIHKDRKSKPLWADDTLALDEKDNSDLSDGENNDSSSDDETGPNEKSLVGEENQSKVHGPSNTVDVNKPENTIEDVSNKKNKTFDFEYTVKLRNLAYSCKKKQIKEFFHPLKILSLRLPRKSKGFSYVSFKTEKDMNKALNKHGGYLGGHRVDVIKYTRKDNFENEKKNHQVRDEKADMELLIETGRIYIRNLCFSVIESDLEQLFSKYGPLSEVYLPIDRLTKRNQGFAFVTYLFAEHAVKAFSELDGSIFQGRLLHLIPAQPKKEIPVDENESNYKKKKEAKMKALSGSSHNWNMLFLSMNAVADIIAEKFNVEKSKLLSGDGKESVAVRMALAETNVVLETRKFLIENGVQVDAFSQAVGERSKTVIIVKHLPAKTTAEELNELFSKHGTIARIILPPHGLVALVEFQEPSEAKEAFKKLAYRRFHHLPLYLEWAPVDGLKDPPPKNEEKEPSNEIDEKSAKDNEAVAEEEDLVEPPQGATVFVKNLNFDTTSENLKKHFKQCGHVLSADVATKKDLKTGKVLSMGFGFVQYKTKESAVKAVKNLNLSKLDGHALEVKISTRATVPSASTKKKKYEIKKQLTSKILVRNIPFQATEKDVKQLFGELGSLRSVRLPKKMGNDDDHRGFAFVEYITKTDAKRAFDALCHSTHLFGRRLVLEWSNPESEDINEIRKKTARDFSESGPKKKLKKSKLKEDVALASARSHNDEE